MKIDLEFNCKKVSFDGKTVEIEGAEVNNIITAICNETDYETVMSAADSTDSKYATLIEWIETTHEFETLLDELEESRREEIFAHFGYVKK